MVLNSHNVGGWMRAIMQENEPRLPKGNVEILREFGDPHADLKPIIAVRIVTVLLILLISFSLDAAVSARVHYIDQPSTLEVWPAGTRLLIPSRVMENYQKEADSWSHPSVYFFANYFFTAPSFRDKRKETVYLPLIKKEVGKMEQREVFVDIMNIRRAQDSDGVFVTIGDLHIVYMSANGKDLYISMKVDN